MKQRSAFRLAVVSLATLAISVATNSRAVTANDTTTANEATTALTRVTADVAYLASDELEGRGPGTEGLKVAAEYIRDEFQKLGLTSGTEDGSYQQPFRVVLDRKVNPEKTKLVLTGPNDQRIELELGTDFQAMNIGGDGSVEAPVVFAGYGISASRLEYDDYRDADVEGKVLLIIRNEPQQDTTEGEFEGPKKTAYSYLRTKVRVAKDKKAAALLVVNDPFTTSQEGKGDTLSPSNVGGTRSLGLPTVQLTQSIVNKILESTPISVADKQLKNVASIEAHIDENFTPMTQSLEGWTAKLETAFQEVNTEVTNVVGVIEGEGPLANETILIGAHYDHLGFGGFGSRRPGSSEVHNGADDNASGTAALLELARRFAELDKKPPRRLVFVAFGAEERGLIGSNYYVSNPLFPLEETIAMLNFDMIGTVRDNQLTLYGIKTGESFPDLVEQASKQVDLQLKTVDGVMAASDHIGFYRKDVPSFHFFSGFTSTYHTPDDDFELINLEGIVKTVDFAELLMTSIAALPERPKFNKVQTSRRSRGGNSRGMAYLGITPDYSADAEGLRVTNVAGGSPAEKAGMKPGDVLLKMEDVEIKDIPALTDQLRKHRPDTKVKITVKRGEEEVTLTVTLGRVG
jgi:hypothetical protein